MGISLTTDILLVNVPRISLVYPPAGTSLLKGICEQQGFTCTVKDANFELLDSIKDADDFEIITNYFAILMKHFETEFYTYDPWGTGLLIN